MTLDQTKQARVSGRDGNNVYNIRQNLSSLSKNRNVFINELGSQYQFFNTNMKLSNK
jgi:hypothetical protein